MIVFMEEPRAAKLSMYYMQKRYAGSFLFRNSQNIKQVSLIDGKHDPGHES